MTKIKIAGETPYVNAQSMAVRKDWTPLAGIFQKALDSISETERNEIYRRWLPIRYEHGFNYALLWQALAAFSVILLALVVWNRGWSREIRSRKQAEEKLRQSEKRYRELYDFLPIPVYEMDFEANITSANRAIYEMFGASAEDFKRGFKAWRLLSPEEIERSSQNLQRLLKGEQVKDTEYTLMRLDGSVFPARSSHVSFTVTAIGWGSEELLSILASASGPRRKSEAWKNVCKGQKRWKLWDCSPAGWLMI